MATIEASAAYGPNNQRNAVTVTWPTMTQTGSDVGEAWEHADFGDRTIQFDGTIGAAGSISLQGSNDGSTWIVLTDPQGNAITKTTLPAIETVTENTRFVRPIINAGDGTTSINARLFARRNR